MVIRHNLLPSRLGLDDQFIESESARILVLRLGITP